MGGRFSTRGETVLFCRKVEGRSQAHRAPRRVDLIGAAVVSPSATGRMVHDVMYSWVVSKTRNSFKDCWANGGDEMESETDVSPLRPYAAGDRSCSTVRTHPYPRNRDKVHNPHRRRCDRPRDQDRTSLSAMLESSRSRAAVSISAAASNAHPPPSLSSTGSIDGSVTSIPRELHKDPEAFPQFHTSQINCVNRWIELTIEIVTAR